MRHRGFLLAEICRVLDCKVHHIRYIEENLPIISTAFDPRGRKIYSLKDLFLFSRILHLTRGRGMGLKPAVDRLFLDLEKPSLDMTARFMQLRHELLKTRLQSIQSTNRLALKYDVSGKMEEGGFQVAAAMTRGAEAGLFRRTGGGISSPLEFFSRELMLPGDSFEDIEDRLLKRLGHSGTGDNDDLRAEMAGKDAGSARRADIGASGGRNAVLDDVLRGGRWLLLTPDPYRSTGTGSYAGSEGFTPIRRLSVLEYMAESIRAAANEYGSFPLWVITVRKRHFHQLLGYLSKRNFFSVPPSSVLILPQPDFNERSTGDAGALFSLKELLLHEPVLQDYLFGLVYSMEHPFIPVPDETLAAELLDSGAPARIASIRRGMAGELYFRLSEGFSLRTVQKDDTIIKSALIEADTREPRDLALIQDREPLRRSLRPMQWEYFPPFFGLDDWDRKLLERQLLRTQRSWMGLSNGELEISPLFARNRKEFARNMANRRRAPGLYF